MTNEVNKTFRFREFPVYNDARKFSKELKIFSTKKFPKKEQYELTSQLSRALNSVILNIAEGSNRGTDKEFALFLNRSQTSLDEVVACLDVALDMNYITSEENECWVLKAANLSSQLTAFRKHLLTNSTK